MRPVIYNFLIILLYYAKCQKCPILSLTFPYFIPNFLE
nr:MAG TPA: hypothetical protein [Caudoviricetes sp.]DAL94000.1 MAG TPA: hypothetical protein [Caudoviricetes sp.]